MPDRKRYTAEEKARALRLCDEVGVVKASEQTGISKFSLYKWRMGAEDEVSMPPVEGEEIPVETVEVEGQAASQNQEGKNAGKRYSVEEKAKALRLCDEIGLSKASKQIGISVNSLYKWRMGVQNEIPTVAAAAEIPIEEPVAEENVSKISPHTNYARENENEELIRLQLENTMLKAKMTALKNALRVFTE